MGFSITPFPDDNSPPTIGQGALLPAYPGDPAYSVSPNIGGASGLPLFATSQMAASAGTVSGTQGSFFGAMLGFGLFGASWPQAWGLASALGSFFGGLGSFGSQLGFSLFGGGSGGLGLSPSFFFGVGHVGPYFGFLDSLGIPFSTGGELYQGYRFEGAPLSYGNQYFPTLTDSGPAPLVFSNGRVYYSSPQLPGREHITHSPREQNRGGIENGMTVFESLFPYDFDVPFVTDSHGAWLTNGAAEGFGFSPSGAGRWNGLPPGFSSPAVHTRDNKGPGEVPDPTAPADPNIVFPWGNTY